jgi:hypothetical protein
MTMSPVVARKTWRTLEPIHGFIYFAPEAVDAYAALGVTGRSGYFASRSAPMGAVPAEVVIATFFNFDPGLVRHAMDGVWGIVTPAALLEARLSAAGAMLRRTLGDLASTPELEEAAGIARTAAEEAALHLAGKPLFAGHATLPWPDEPLNDRPVTGHARPRNIVRRCAVPRVDRCDEAQPAHCRDGRSVTISTSWEPRHHNPRPSPYGDYNGES